MVNVRDKDSQVKLSECCLIVMDELENMSRNLDALKELITKRDIHIRKAYSYTHDALHSPGLPCQARLTTKIFCTI